MNNKEKVMEMIKNIPEDEPLPDEIEALEEGKRDREKKWNDPT